MLNIVAVITTNIINIAMEISSKQSGQEVSAITEAAKTHTLLFIVYIFFLIITVIFAVLVWKASNKYQDAVKTDADSKIAIADEKAEDARVKQRELEQENLKLQGEVAHLQIRAANAERSLLELKERLKPRHLTNEQKAHLISALKGKSPGDVWLSCPVGDKEACNFARQILDVLRFSEWNILNNDVMSVTISTSNVSSITGIVISIQDNKSVPIGVTTLYEYLSQHGFAIRIEKTPKHGAEIWVGAKPQVK